MAKFLMFGRYTAEALRGISADRTKHALSVIDRHGGSVDAMYAMLGGHDLLLIVDLPDVESAMKASIALNKMTGVAFTTCPAVTVERFDEIAGEA